MEKTHCFRNPAKMVRAPLPLITTRGYQMQMQQPLKERSRPSLMYTPTDIASTRAWTKAREAHRQRVQGCDNTNRVRKLATGQVVQRNTLLNHQLLSKTLRRMARSATWRRCKKSRLSKRSTKKQWTLTDLGWKQASTSRSWPRCRHMLRVTS